MLKINLLTEDKARRASTPSTNTVSTFLLVGAVASVVLLLGGLFLFHASQDKELQSLVEQNTRVQSEIESIRSRVGDHQRILDELAEAQRREDAIRELQNARTGPTAMFVEVSRMLSRGGVPTADPTVVERLRSTNQRDRMWSPTWDFQRLWITELIEENRSVRISGEGRTPDDVGEFMRRLQLSVYFRDVRLDSTQAATASGPRGGGVTVQKFTIVARVRY
ncbi:MAG: PilN domain-containing protein [Myxococcales bacterium]|nr:PilN domain-containing protein [Myxococcales bacterium]